MRISLYAICAIGIFLNVAVFWKRKVRSKRQSQTTRISLQLLCFMAAADTISLAALLLLLCTQYLGIKDDTLMSVICKEVPPKPHGTIILKGPEGSKKNEVCAKIGANNHYK
uniref:Uncharacterized protein n=1 Tax=Acrobeloides nanus TaxID=290746 RepID=A0A914D3C8_9BILA